MTISVIDTNRPEPIRKPGETPLPEVKDDSRQVPTSCESLQEVTDQASLSGLAPRIQALLHEMAGSENNVLQQLTDNVDRLQEGFVDALYSAFSKENINLDKKMTLRLNTEGNLFLSGEHEEKTKVDAILAENPALSTAFGEIASQSEVLRDITNINKVMTRQTGVDAYAAGAGNAPLSVYQMSLKGDMSHFYFSRG